MRNATEAELLEQLYGRTIDALSPWSRTELYRMARERAGRCCTRLALRHEALRVWAEQLQEQESETVRFF